MLKLRFWCVLKEGYGIPLVKERKAGHRTDQKIAVVWLDQVERAAIE